MEQENVFQALMQTAGMLITQVYGELIRFMKSFGQPIGKQAKVVQ